MNQTSHRQNSSEQKNTRLNKKSVQEVSKQKREANGRHPKTDVRYWEKSIFQPTYTRDGLVRRVGEWAAKIQHLGRRETFSLGSANRTFAAARAKQIYFSLKSAGWDVTLQTFKPEMAPKPVSTVGDLLAELREHWSGKMKTLEDYYRSFRTILSQIFGIEGGREKYDYVNGGRKSWIGRIDRIKLADVTPDKINRWRIGFVKRVGGDPKKQRRARISCNSLMQQAKSLFSPNLLKHVRLETPEKLPFDGVDFYDGESMRYHSTIDVESLIQDAIRDLPQEQLKIFLLAAMGGLRKNEIDKLQWSAFHWSEGFMRIEASEFFSPKTSDSEGEVWLDKEFLPLLRGWHAKSTSPFVVEADVDPRNDARYTHYRAQRHFDGLTAWLRTKGVTAVKPLHELRKEFGSQLCAKYGIYAASRMLRHSGIGITAEHYLDQKERVTVGFGHLLSVPANKIVPLAGTPIMQQKRTSRKRS
jgi:integrase